MVVVQGKFAHGNTFRAYERQRVEGRTIYSESFYGKTKTEAVAGFKKWKTAGGFGVKIAESTAKIAAKPEPKAVTVGSFVQEWFDGYVSRWAKTTQEVNKHRLPYIVDDPTLAGIPLDKFGKSDVRAWLARIDTTENNKGKVLQLLGQAMRQALDDEIISSNPCDILNRPQKTKADVVPFTTDEAKAIVAHVTGGPYEAMVRTMLDSGVRPEELFALRWSAVDFKAGTIRIERVVMSLASGRRGEIRESTKTAGSRRTIKLADKTLAALQALKTHSTSEYCFVPTNGASHHPFFFYGIFAAPWAKILKDAGVAYRTPYAARHTMATELLRNGVSVVAVSKRMGHASSKMTLDIYAHFMPEDDTKSAAVIGSLFG
jgi:integrase